VRVRRPPERVDARLWVCLMCLEAAGWCATQGEAERASRAHLATCEPGVHPLDGVRIFARSEAIQAVDVPGGSDNPENVERRLRVVRTEYL